MEHEAQNAIFGHEAPVSVDPALPRDPRWIDELSDAQCMEIFWLYVESPDEFLNAHPAPLLGAAMRYALRQVQADAARLDPEGGPRLPHRTD